MKKSTAEEVMSIVSDAKIAVIHFDAEWDGYRMSVQRQLVELANAGSTVAFAHVDVDEEQELAKSANVLNVPTVAYYRSGRLVATVIGEQQNIADNIEKLMNGDAI